MADGDAKPTVDERPPSSGRDSRPERKSTSPPEPGVAPPAFRYWTGSEIARGGMGRVVEATDTLLGRVVAVKEALSTDADALRRFQRETRITARLEHPSIVPVYDAGKSPDGSPYYVMRKVSGRPLEDLARAATTLGERLALLPHILAAAQAVAHAHGRGILHRDLKPSNILVGDLGETVVIDWGLAKVVDEPDDDDGLAASRPQDSLRTRFGTVFGTPGFMSPEQLRGDPVERTSDVYALGATLYHLLAGRPPHAAESGDEMMRRAEQGPATPIARLVDELPRELSTIVDKALAFKAADRYPDAGAFAEDLQRFLTGQLVASHDYTTRERVFRFLRTYRVAVVVASVALVALLVGGVLAVRRIVAERDRADTHAKLAVERQHEAELAHERERERAEQLYLTQASTLVATNPTGAVAMLQQLAQDPARWAESWRDARAIAASARAAGVAKGMPGPVVPMSIAISPNGQRALLTGLDGTVRIYELATNQARIVATIKPDPSATFTDDDHVLAYRGHTLHLVDIATGAQRSFTIETEIWDISANATLAYYVDFAHQLWRLELATGHATRVGTEPYIDVELSWDGRHVGLRSDRRVAVIDLASPSGMPRSIGPAGATGIAWSPNSRIVVASYPNRVGRFTRGDTGNYTTEWYQHDGPTFTPVALDDDLAVTSSFGGIDMKERSALVRRYPSRIDAGRGIHLGSHGRVIASVTNRVLVFEHDREVQIPAPVEGITRVSAHPNSPFAIAAAPGYLLVWNVDRVLPRGRTIERGVVSFSLIDDHDVMASHVDGTWSWLDLATGVQHSLPGLPPLLALQPSSDGDRVLGYEPTPGDRSYLIDRDTKRVRELDGDLDFGVFRHATLFAATRTGGVVEIDAGSLRRRTLYSHRAQVKALGWDGDWLAALYDDGHAWRTNLKTRVEQTLALPVTRSLQYLVLRQRADGTAFLPVGKRVIRWAPDGTQAAIAELPAELAVVLSVEDVLVVGTIDGAWYVVHLDHPDRIDSAIPAGTLGVSIADPHLAVFTSKDQAPRMIDLDVGRAWPLLGVGSASALRYPAISHDARQVLALDRDHLLAWDVDVPGDAAATKAWLFQLTNASAELGTTTMTWH
ncbi:MAG TPA: WD40 repeat domain-containing serine/threonine protein kinase [Kofleriaceae bacterium]|nr:WD40 repeat domain-containing serine/threonine protein kinase [Kofleriaceae bacterium]